jgi:hypothetical protein
MTENDLGLEPSWKSFFRLAGICAVLIILMGLTDVVLSSTAGEVTVNSMVPVREWFEMFRLKPVSAFSNLGMINLINLTLEIPIFIALIYAQRKSVPAFSLLAGILFLIGVVVYYSSNTVLPMYGLSKEYTLAVDAEKPLIEAAGRALLARGADLSLGTFSGFLLSQSAGLLIGFILLKTKFLGKLAPWIAIAGYSFMLAFFIISAFNPAQFNLAMILSAPGGLLLMAFQVFIALKFFQLSK